MRDLETEKAFEFFDLPEEEQKSAVVEALSLMIVDAEGNAVFKSPEQVKKLGVKIFNLLAHKFNTNMRSLINEDGPEGKD